MFRESCGKCHFCNTRRPSDITIGDFWGWEKTAPEMNKDDKGISLVLINTSKGKELFEAVRDRMNVVSAELENCLQPNLCHPSDIHPDHDKFVRDYCAKGFEYVVKRYLFDKNKSVLCQVKQKLKHLIKIIQIRFIR